MSSLYSSYRSVAQYNTLCVAEAFKKRMASWDKQDPLLLFLAAKEMVCCAERRSCKSCK